jgi:hypothetical protein
LWNQTPQAHYGSFPGAIPQLYNPPESNYWRPGTTITKLTDWGLPTGIGDYAPGPVNYLYGFPNYAPVPELVDAYGVSIHKKYSVEARRLVVEPSMLRVTFDDITQTLAASSTASVHVPASGQKLAALENAQFKLQFELEKYENLIQNGISDRESERTLLQFASTGQGLTAGKFIDLTDGAFSIFSTLYQALYGRDAHPFECTESVVREVGRRLVELNREFRRKIANIKRRLFQNRSSYCGLSWSRRFWFLLHGSHPPKTEGCQSFGYAIVAV